MLARDADILVHVKGNYMFETNEGEQKYVR